MLTNPRPPMTDVPMADLRSVRFSYDGGRSWILDDVNLRIAAGERICLIGRNGSGKSTLARLLAGLVAPDSGSVQLAGYGVFDENGSQPAQYRTARRRIGAVFQNPMDQIVTTVVSDDVAFGPENLAFKRSQITEQVDSSLASVDMRDFANANPSRMSGGQQQRVAMAGILAMAPKMVVLDEPTAMLDSEASMDVMQTLDALQHQGVTIVHVTHKPQELSDADRILELTGGHLRETSRSDAIALLSTDEATEQHAHEQIERLTESTPAVLETESVQGDPGPAVSFTHVSYRYPQSSVDAIHDLSLTINRGKTIAIMGRNGSGKSTLTKLMAALRKPTNGTITVDGVGNLSKLSKRDRKRLRSTLGLVMQRPEQQLFASTVEQDVAYGPRNLGLSEDEVAHRVETSLKLLGLDRFANRSPFSLSGGQQRLAAIAGIIACQPQILVLDEPCAGLDAEATIRIEELIGTLRQKGVTIVLITHSRGQAYRLADQIVTLDGAASRTVRLDDGSQTVSQTGTASINSADNAQDTQTATTHRGSPQTSQPETSVPSSRLGRLDPRVKLLSFLALMFSSFAMGSPQELVLGAIMIIGLIVLGRISPLQLLSKTRGFLIIFIILGIFNMLFVRSGDTLVSVFGLPITTDGAISAILSICRLTLVILLGAILLETTTPTTLTDGFDSMLSPFKRFGLHSQETALVMSLALRFVPTLSDEAKTVVEAQAVRAGSIETGSPRARIRAAAAIIVPVFAGAIRHADNLALALDVRCYEEGIERTHWHQLKLNKRDLAFLALCLIYAVAFIGFHTMPWQPWR